MKKLNLKYIQSFNMTETTFKPDWDDVSIKFELPSGIEVSGAIVMFNRPCKTNMLEGLNGYLLIETQEDLAKYHAMSYEEIINSITDENFNKSDYL